MAYAFYNCKSLKTITNLDTINTAYCYQYTKAFAGCSSLESLDLSSFNTNGLTAKYGNDRDSIKTAVYGMFQGCYSLKEFKTAAYDSTNFKDPT